MLAALAILPSFTLAAEQRSDVPLSLIPLPAKLTRADGNFAIDGIDTFGSFVQWRRSKKEHLLVIQKEC